jgi:5-methylcytosine-specific restriction endonuclease McrA
MAWFAHEFRGPASPHWRDGSTLRYAPRWRAIAAEARERAGNRCQDCGRAARPDRGALPVHHLDEDPTNHAPENLLVVCRPCHRLRHAQLTRQRRERAVAEQLQAQ